MIFQEHYKKNHTNSLGKVHFALLLRRTVSCTRSHKKIVKIHQIACLNTGTCADTTFYFLDILLCLEYSNQINTRTQKCSDHIVKTKSHLPTDPLFNSSPMQMLRAECKDRAGLYGTSSSYFPTLQTFLAQGLPEQDAISTYLVILDGFLFHEFV